MGQYIYFLIGMVIMFIIIKVIFPKPVTIKLHPNLKNYDDITYIDEEGKLYKYELYTIK
jgi:hypothetical protein